MKIRILKHMLRSVGVTYHRGDVAELPDGLARSLLQEYPDEFVLVPDARDMNVHEHQDVAEKADATEDVTAALEAADKPKAKK